MDDDISGTFPTTTHLKPTSLNALPGVPPLRLSGPRWVPMGWLKLPEICRQKMISYTVSLFFWGGARG